MYTGYTIYSSLYSILMFFFQAGGFKLPFIVFGSAMAAFVPVLFFAYSEKQGKFKMFLLSKGCSDLYFFFCKEYLSTLCGLITDVC